VTSRTTSDLDTAVLDDPVALEAADPGGVLRAVASSGAQVRAALGEGADAGIDRLREEGRPRGMVVAGLGGSGVVGDVVATLATPGCPVPIQSRRGYTLPGWVGPLDLVAVVSCSGTTEEALSLATDAVRRGSRLAVVSAAGSPLANLAEQAGAAFLPVEAGSRAPRANLWAMAVPLLRAAHELRLLDASRPALEAVADRLDELATVCRPASESFLNPAKTLALDLAGTLPLVWGSSDLAGVAAYRLTCQLNENAKYPAIHGALPEPNHNQVVTFAGPYADSLADPVVGSAGPRLRLVLLRDGEEHPRLARRCTASRQLAEEAGVPVSELRAEGSHPLLRLAQLVATGDFASVYLALLLDIDPEPITPLTELKERIAR